MNCPLSHPPTPRREGYRRREASPFSVLGLGFFLFELFHHPATREPFHRVIVLQGKQAKPMAFRGRQQNRDAAKVFRFRRISRFSHRVGSYIGGNHCIKYSQRILDLQYKFDKRMICLTSQTYDTLSGHRIAGGSSRKRQENTVTHSIRQSIMENVSYAQDHRVRARERRGSTIPNFDKQTITFVGIVYHEHEDGSYEESDLTLPAKVCVCPTCNGRGKHVNPSVDAGGLSADDFYEDPDFTEEYMSGTYDVTCYDCGGRNVVLEVDEDRAAPADLEVLHDHWKSEADSRDERMAEMRMGA